jgi:hypothetical protein
MTRSLPGKSQVMPFSTAHRMEEEEEEEEEEDI